MTRKINIIACGGFGQNIMLGMMKRDFFPQLEKNLALYALDTSKANLRKYEDIETKVACHLVPQADGSGKFRGENHESISTMVNDLVNSGVIEPGLDIVIFSASGGSGGVIGADMMEALTRKGRSVVGMALETDEDFQALTNTFKTVKTLQHKASQGTRNFTVYWSNNRDGNGNINSSMVNQFFLETLENLIAIGHPSMARLDTRDIHNWLNYPINSSEPGELRFLTVQQRGKDESFAEVEDIPLSALSLLDQEDLDPQFPMGVGYSTHGILPDNLAFTGDRIETQYLIFGRRVAKLANHLDAKIKEIEKLRKQQAERDAGNTIRSSKDDVVSDTGQFL